MFDECPNYVLTQIEYMIVLVKHQEQLIKVLLVTTFRCLLSLTWPSLMLFLIISSFTQSSHRFRDLPRGPFPSSVIHCPSSDMTFSILASSIFSPIWSTFNCLMSSFVLQSFLSCCHGYYHVGPYSVWYTWLSIPSSVFSSYPSICKSFGCLVGFT